MLYLKNIVVSSCAVIITWFAMSFLHTFSQNVQQVKDNTQDVSGSVNTLELHTTQINHIIGWINAHQDVPPPK